MGRKLFKKPSLKRALGISAAKGKASRKIGIPLTASGRKKKVKRITGCCVPFIAIFALLAVAFAALAHPGRTDANGGHYNRKTGEYHYHNGGSSSSGPSSGVASGGSSPRSATDGGFGTQGAGPYPRTQTAQTPQSNSSVRGVSLQAKVVGITDGDTLVALDANNTQAKIRLNGVDAPESTQAFGSRAKQFASDLCFGQQVTLKLVDEDRYGRFVADVILSDGRNLNHELVRAGMAWWYEEYAKGDTTLQKLQEEAKSQKVGLWSEPNPIAPWDFRRGATTPKVDSAPKPESGLGTFPDRGTAAPRTVQPAPQADTQGSEVFVTNTGKKYHRSGCRYLSKSQIPIDLDRAKAAYGPCSVCNPPR